MIQKTILNDNRSTPRADFQREVFDKLIFEKGRSVLVEKALLCPCKSRAANQQSTCRNCGGVGWVFINPRETRMILSGMDAVSKQMGWSEELQGMINVTCLPEEELAFMDRITVLNGESIYTEVLHFKNHNAKLFAYTAYNIKSILNIALFEGASTKLKPLLPLTDYTFERNTIILNNSYLPTSSPLDISVTIRYKYAPTFIVSEHKRETIQSYRIQNGIERNQDLPISAYAKRSHYVLTALNLAGDRLLSNNYVIKDCSTKNRCESPIGNIISNSDLTIPIPPTSTETYRDDWSIIEW